MKSIHEFIAFRKICLENAETALRSAKALQATKANHIAFHLATLSLEEIGKVVLYWSSYCKYEKRVYELRSYEGPTEKISANKIRMFNSGDEMGLFKRLGFNDVFYVQVVAGSSMPNLMYMTTFENRADREKHCDAFGKAEYWKKLSAMPEYQKNVSKGNTWFLYPTDYSDI